MNSNHSQCCRHEGQETVHTRDPGVDIICHQDTFVPIARITRIQSRFGAVRVQILFEEFRLFEAGRRVILDHGNKRQEAIIENFRQQNGRWVLKLEGFESISDAEDWIGSRILVEKKEIPPKESGSFYNFELEGCEVFVDSKLVGRISQVLDNAGASLLSIDNDGEEILIPFVKAFLKKVDLDSKRVELELPEGLIELNRKEK